MFYDIFENSFIKCMLFNSIFRNVNITLLCITNTPTMLYAACPEKKRFHLGWGGGGEGWRTRPPLSEFSGSAPDETFLIITRSVKSYSTKMVNVFFP